MGLACHCEDWKLKLGLEFLHLLLFTLGMGSFALSRLNVALQPANTSAFKMG
jgi:hypothetical protein